MKKINLILGACAIAAAALLVSCNNGAKDYVDVTTINNKYVYNVTGSVTTTNKNGTTAASSVDVTKQTIKTALARVSWNDDKVDESNYDEYNVIIEGKANFAKADTAPGATTATETKWSGDFGFEKWSDPKTVYWSVPRGWYSNSYAAQFSEYERIIATGDAFYGNPNYISLPTPLNTVEANPVYADPTDPSYVGNAFWFPGYSDYVQYRESEGTYLELVFFEFDGDYYINFDNHYVKLPEDAIDGDFGDDEITIKYSETNNTRWGMSETQKNDTTYVGSTETAYDLTFKLVEAE